MRCVQAIDTPWCRLSEGRESRGTHLSGSPFRSPRGRVLVAASEELSESPTGAEERWTDATPRAASSRGREAMAKVRSQPGGMAGGRGRGLADSPPAAGMWPVRTGRTVDAWSVKGKHALERVRDFPCLAIRQATQASDEPRRVHGAYLVQGDLSLPAPEGDIHPSGMLRLAEISGATLAVRMCRFISSGETTTHGRVFRISWPRMGSRSTR